MSRHIVKRAGCRLTSILNGGWDSFQLNVGFQPFGRTCSLLQRNHTFRPPVDAARAKQPADHVCFGLRADISQDVSQGLLPAISHRPSEPTYLLSSHGREPVPRVTSREYRYLRVVSFLLLFPVQFPLRVGKEVFSSDLPPTQKMSLLRYTQTPTHCSLAHRDTR